MLSLVNNLFWIYPNLNPQLSKRPSCIEFLAVIHNGRRIDYQIFMDEQTYIHLTMEKHSLQKKSLF